MAYNVQMADEAHSLNESLTETIAKLQDEQRILREKDLQLGAIIADLQKLAASQTNADIPAVTTGQYKGMKLGVALESYLKARPGHTIPLVRGVQDLTKGGAYLGKQRAGRTLEESHLQNLRIALVNKRALVDWDQTTNTMRLAASASNPPKMRKR